MASDRIELWFFELKDSLPASGAGELANDGSRRGATRHGDNARKIEGTLESAEAIRAD